LGVGKERNPNFSNENKEKREGKIYFGIVTIIIIK